MSMIALFGKLPAHGDFVARGFSHDQKDRIDAWLSQSLAQVRTDLGDAFEQAFDHALPWRCVGDQMAGAMAASQDGLSRRFPILLLIGDPAAAARCEALLYAAIGEGWDADRLVREAGGTSGAVPIEAVELWFSADNDATGETLPGPCPPSLLPAMLARLRTV